MSAEEHAATTQAMFQKLDVDHDGFITKTELSGARSKPMRKPAR